VIAATVRARLIALSLVTSGTGNGTAWVCFIGGLNDSVAAPQVAVVDTAGLPALMSHGTGRPLRPGLQVLVRGLPNSEPDVGLKAEAIFDGLHRTAWGDLMTIEAVNTPIWLGYEPDTNAPMWSINFLTIQR